MSHYMRMVSDLRGWRNWGMVREIFESLGQEDKLFGVSLRSVCSVVNT